MPGRRGVVDVGRGAGIGMWFTGARIAGVSDANLAHHVPHVPERLAEARQAVATLTATRSEDWHLMRQVHGAAVGVVDRATPRGVELRGVDVIVTTVEERPLVVLTADCLPILAVGLVAVGAAHAGWRGIVADAPGALVRALEGAGERASDLRVVIGPAIGPCCYAVGPEVRVAVAAIGGPRDAFTRDGRPAVDLRAAARARLAELGVVDVRDADAEGRDAPACTACDPHWFSHRRDPHSGRQAGIVVRRGEGTRRGA